MRYAHFAKIWEKCGKVPNMRQLHIRVFLTCLFSHYACSDTSRMGGGFFEQMMGLGDGNTRVG